MSCRINTGKSQSVSGMFYNDRRLCFCACNGMTWRVGQSVPVAIIVVVKIKRLLNFFQTIGLCLNFRLLNARRLLADATKATVKLFGHIGQCCFFFFAPTSIKYIHTRSHATIRIRI